MTDQKMKRKWIENAQHEHFLLQLVKLLNGTSGVTLRCDPPVAKFSVFYLDLSGLFATIISRNELEEYVWQKDEERLLHETKKRHMIILLRIHLKRELF